MDFSLSEEQQLLKDSVDRFVREQYALSRRRQIAESPEGFSREHWRTMAQLGWLGASLPEEHGGSGGGAVETMIVMEGFGRGLVLEPYLACVVLGGGLLLDGGTSPQKESLLPKLVSGDLLLAFAYAEPRSRYDLHHVETVARAAAGGFRLNGIKGVVAYGATADKLIVSARTAGSTRDREGITLFLVDRAAEGVTMRDYRTIDGQRAAEIEIRDVKVGPDDMLGERDHGLSLIESAARRGISALSAEAVGIMETMKELTNDYLKTRQQFGRPIGRFQVLQHCMVDILIACEEARSCMLVATLRLDDEDATLRDKAVAAAKVKIGQSGRFVGQNAIQLHGGMGMTDEMAIAHYFKRLAMIDVTFGDHAYHLQRYTTL